MGEIEGKFIDRGTRLLQFFTERKYKSKRAFAELLNIQESNLNKYFKGYLDPLNLSDALFTLHCNIEWIATGHGEMISRTAVMEPSAQYTTNQALVKKIESQQQLIDMLLSERDQMQRILSSQAVRVILETTKQDAHKRENKKQLQRNPKTRNL